MRDFTQLCDSLKNADSLSSFKFALEKFLFESYEKHYLGFILFIFILYIYLLLLSEINRNIIQYHYATVSIMIIFIFVYNL